MNANIDSIKTDLNKEELRIIYTFLNSFFIGLLKPVKPSDLEYYINKMTVFDVRPYFEKIPKRFRQKVSEMAKNNKNLVKEFITPISILDQAQKKRPDLYEVLKIYQGRVWLERFMMYIQKVILAL
jgi:hypothetical protein